MDRNTGKSDPSRTADSRKDRLKAALKANLQKRKAQTKARKTTDNKKG